MMDFVYRKAGEFYNKHIGHIENVLNLFKNKICNKIFRKLTLDFTLVNKS